MHLKKIPRKDLITIRKGEFAYNPVTDRVQATKHEIVKLSGTGRDWTCCYYDVTSCGCTIYDHRPLESDLLSRFDILEQDTFLQGLNTKYETACPLPDFTVLSRENNKLDADSLSALEISVNQDLEFRNRVVLESPLVLEEEMFLFGRPLFQLLQPFGFLVFQSGNRLHLQIQKK